MGCKYSIMYLSYLDEHATLKNEDAPWRGWLVFIMVSLLNLHRQGALTF